MPDTSQETNKPPRVRWGLLLAFVGVSALVAMALIVVTLFNIVEDSFRAPPLSHGQREEIARANCQQLPSLQTGYAGDGDSDDPDPTALRLIRERQAERHCPRSD